MTVEVEEILVRQTEKVGIRFAFSTLKTQLFHPFVDQFRVFSPLSFGYGFLHSFEPGHGRNVAGGGPVDGGEVIAPGPPAHRLVRNEGIEPLDERDGAQAFSKAQIQPVNPALMIRVQMTIPLFG